MGETCQLVAGSCITGATLGLFGQHISQAYETAIFRDFETSRTQKSAFLLYTKRGLL